MAAKFQAANVVLPPEHDLVERVRRINIWCHDVGAHQPNLCKYQLLVRYNTLYTPPETPLQHILPTAYARAD